MAGFTDRLERRAWNLVTEAETSSRTLQEIALVLEQLRRTRQLYERLRRDLLQSEVAVDNALLQSAAHPEQFQAQLRQIAAERRKLAVQEEQALQTLHVRLVTLVDTYEQIGETDGRPQTRPKA